MAWVDAGDWARLAAFSWYAIPRANGKGFYAVRNARRASGGYYRVWLHHDVLGLAPPQKVDHRDGDGLNNRRRNLRPCTTLQNNVNRALPNATGYRGVRPQPNGRWCAKMRIGGRSTHLGSFDTPEEAARAYDAAARAEHGEFARLNFP